jgi:hypothetical protein
MFRYSKNITMGNCVTITGGKNIRRIGTVVKVLPRSYHVKFDTVEKPGERTPMCVRAWNVEKSSSSASYPPSKSTSTSPAPSPLFALSTPDANTSRGRKKKRVETVSTDEIAQVVLPVLKGMSSLTKDE